MALCPICAGDIPRSAPRCPRCGTPVASAEPGQGWSAVGAPGGAQPRSPGAEPAGEPEQAWSPAPPMAPPPPDVGPGPRPVPPGSRPVVAQEPVRRDWPGALRAAGQASLAAYVLGAGLAVLLAPPGSPTAVLWVAAPAALLAVALGGHWQATLPGLDGGGSDAFGYQVHAFPLLLTGLVVLVLVRAVRARFETGRANDTLRDRLRQAPRVAAALGGCGLFAGLLSRYAPDGGVVTHAGYLSAPLGGLLIGGVVAGLVAVGYDPTQLPVRARALWAGLRVPGRTTRQVLLLATAAGLLCVLLALEASTPDDLAATGQDRRLLSGLAIASAPNLGWWFLVSFLGVPVRADLLSGQPGTGVGALLQRSGFSLPGVLLAAAVLLGAAVRLMSGATDRAGALRRLAWWVALVAAAAVAFVLVGVLRLSGEAGLFPVEYRIGSTSPLALLLPPAWAAVAGVAGYAIHRARLRR